MIRETSIETYYEIKNNNLLSKKRMEVYDIIYNNGPVNCRQIINIASKGQVTNTGAISGRLSELEERGVIYDKFEAPCPVTGNKTIFWDTTNKLPIKPKKSLTKLQKAEKFIKDKGLSTEYTLWLGSLVG